ncbi:MAG: Gfo/Idh/MocA family oxidoreductase [Pigmentiphaga sp.]|nr:Gfo/Idh/MocA family oxidoreductase [Pigmentiphaga sp.]
MKTKLFIFGIVFFFNTTSFIQAEIRIGIIGLDTSHALEFTKLINEDESGEYQNFRIIAAYPYGSKTIQSSYERIPGYTEEVKQYGVEIVSSISELLKQVDCVMLETNDGNLHLAQALEVFKAGKIMFIDKPVAATLADAIAIFELSKKYNVPVFSSSALRFSQQTQKLKNGELGEIIGADCYSPHKVEPSHPDFGWYGVHGVEMLFSVMGTGCEFVNRMSSERSDVVIGLWNDGRIGTFRGLINNYIYGGIAYTDQGAVPIGGYDGYKPLLNQILDFFSTHMAPVSEKETLEIFTFMEASNISKKHHGKIISMKNTYEKAQKKAKKLIQQLNE